jgi:Type II secretion system (T2SS), protein F
MTAFTITRFAGIAPWVLGAGWGVVVATPLARTAGRRSTATRTAALRAPAVVTGETGAVRARLGRARARVRTAFGPVARVAGALGRRRRARRAEAALARELPVTLDLLGVAVGAGCTPFLAVDATARWAPPRFAALLTNVVGACSLNVGFDDALDDLVDHAPSLQALADALLVTDRLGAPAGPALARLADEQRATLRRRAEAHARRVPVRLLFPLIFLVLPAFGLLTVVPTLLNGMAHL